MPTRAKQERRAAVRWKGMDNHMKNKRHFLRGAALAGVCAALAVTATVAAEPGSAKDPLVTLSYLNDTFMGQLLDRVDQKIAERDRKLASQGVGGSAAASFAVVDIPKGKTLIGDIGCEVMLRVGSAVCVSPSAPGLIDETGGTTLNNGAALVKNHMYMMTIEGRGVKATADTVKVLVRGGYTIG